MKNWKLLFAAVMSFSLSPLAAIVGPNCDPCLEPCLECDLCDMEACSFFDGVTVYGDALYWRVRRSDLDYALNYDTTNAIGQVYSVSPRYDGGFRLGFSKDCGCGEFEARYTYYQANNDNSITNDAGFLAGTRLIGDLTSLSQGIIEFAKGAWNFELNELAFLAGHHFCPVTCIDMRVFGGFKTLFLKESFDTLYSTSVDINEVSNKFDTLRQTIEMGSYGVNIGIEGSYFLRSCLSFYGNFSYDFLLGSVERRYFYDNTDDGGQTFTNLASLRDNSWRTISVLNLAVGFQYGIETFYCSDLIFSFGYELHHLINLADFMQLQDLSGEINYDRNTNNSGIDGVYVRLSAGF